MLTMLFPISIELITFSRLFKSFSNFRARLFPSLTMRCTLARDAAVIEVSEQENKAATTVKTTTAIK